MNIETAKHFLPLVKALSEGKTLQFWNAEEWADLTGNNITFSYSPEKYRIKPEPKLVPFTEEDYKDLLGKIIVSKNYKSKKLICEVLEKRLVAGVSSMLYDSLLASYTFEDGSPCGKIITE